MCIFYNSIPLSSPQTSPYRSRPCFPNTLPLSQIPPGMPFCPGWEILETSCAESERRIRDIRLCISGPGLGVRRKPGCSSVQSRFIRFSTLLCRIIYEDHIVRSQGKHSFFSGSQRAAGHFREGTCVELPSQEWAW